MMSVPREKILYMFFPTVLILIYFLFTLPKINFPGVQYDEILFGNAAVGMIDHSFIALKIWNFPIMLMSYIGALKAYLFYPIFKVFGVSVYSIRIPMIIIGGFSLCFLYKALQLYFDEFIALVALLFIVFDISFINFMRYDVGPTVIEFFCKAVTLFTFIKFIKEKKVIYLVMTLLVLGLGLFNKLNFIWYINAFSIAAILFYRQDLSLFLKEHSQKTRIISVVSISYCLYYLYFFMLIYFSHMVISPYSLSDKILRNYHTFRDIVSGVAFYNYVFGDMNLFIQNAFYWAVIIICLLGLLINLSKINKSLSNYQRKSYLFFIAIFCMIFLQIIYTDRAAKDWHLFSIYPFYTIILVVSLFSIANLFPQHGHILSLAFILFISYQAFIYYQYYISYDKPVKNVFWAKEINELINYTKDKPNKFISLDWGIHNQLITFTQLKNKYFEMTFTVKNQKMSVALRKDFMVNELLNPDNHYMIIMHTEQDALFKDHRRALFKYAQEYQKPLTKIKSINDENGRIIFEICAPVK